MGALRRGRSLGLSGGKPQVQLVAERHVRLQAATLGELEDLARVVEGSGDDGDTPQMCQARLLVPPAAVVAIRVDVGEVHMRTNLHDGFATSSVEAALEATLHVGVDVHLEDLVRRDAERLVVVCGELDERAVGAGLLKGSAEALEPLGIGTLALVAPDREGANPLVRRCAPGRQICVRNSHTQGIQHGISPSFCSDICQAHPDVNH